MLLYRTCTSTLQHMDISETGRCILGLHVSPFLKIGYTLAMSQSDGTTPVLREKVLRLVQFHLLPVSRSWPVTIPGLKPCVHQGPSIVLAFLPR